jgi:hypothetical protein
MTVLLDEIELSKKEQDLLRFLIRDQALSTEFLVTTIQEYYQRNRPEEKKHE